MDTVLNDLRITLRALRRSPGIATAVVLILAAGIGASTALFSVVHGVLLRPLPYPAPERIVQLWQVNEEGGQTGVSDPNFADWAARGRGFRALAQLQSQVTSVAGGSEPVRRTAAYVSRDFFEVMGVRPMLGRGFVPDEQREGAAAAVIVGHEFWQQQLGGDPDLARHTLTFWDRSHTVVWFMPSGFDFPGGTQLWTPRELLPVLPSRTALNWQVIGRLHDGVTLAAAQHELRALTRSIRAEEGDIRWFADAAVVPLHEQLVGRVRPVLLMQLGAASFLLLVAGANVLNLLLARSASRQRELAVRVALGASRWRLLQQTMTESLVLTLPGGALGALLAHWGVQALLVLEPGNLPRTEQIGVSTTVLAFALLVSLAVAGVLGTVGASHARRAEMRGELAGTHRSQSGGTSARRVQGGMVTLQVALTLVLLVGAGLVGRTLLRLLAIDPGFRTTDVLTMQVSLSGMGDERARLARFHDELIERLRRVPGVAEAGGVSQLPLAGFGASGTFVVQSHPDEVADLEDFGALAEVPGRSGYAAYRVASDGYFRVMDIPLLHGRLFDDRDTPDAPHVALISESLARTQWPDEAPLGKLIQFGNMDGDLRPFTVIGVVADIHEQAVDAEPQPTVYALHRQRHRPAREFTLVMQGSAAPAAMSAAARGILGELAPDAAPRIRTIEEVVSAPLAARRFSLMLLGVFGAVAMLLAVAGIYGVTTYTVAQRTHEIGIRMALGARTGDVLHLVVRHGALLAASGVGIGVVAALALTRVLAHLLYGVSATDPATFAAAALLLVAVAVLASLVPARRAARVDPMIALRAE